MISAYARELGSWGLFQVSALGMTELLKSGRSAIRAYGPDPSERERSRSMTSEPPTLLLHESDQVEARHFHCIANVWNPRPIEVSAQRLFGHYDPSACTGQRGVALLTSRVTLRDSASMLLPRTCLLMCGRRGVWVLMR